MQNSKKIKSKILGEDARNTKPKFIKCNGNVSKKIENKNLKINVVF
jgi:hypothetical protein